MDYQIARSELQSPPARVSMSSMAIEALVMLSIAMMLVWLV